MTININNGAALLDAVGAALPYVRREARRRGWTWYTVPAEPDEIAGAVWLYLHERGIQDAERHSINKAIAAALAQIERERKKAPEHYEDIPGLIDLFQGGTEPEKAFFQRIENRCLFEGRKKAAQLERIAELLINGYTAGEIAEKLGCTRRTIENKKAEIRSILSLDGESR